MNPNFLPSLLLLPLTTGAALAQSEAHEALPFQPQPHPTISTDATKPAGPVLRTQTPQTVVPEQSPAPDGVRYQAPQARTSWPQPLPPSGPVQGEVRLNAPDHATTQPDWETRVHYDEREGAIWSLGKNYKSVASTQGFTFIPFLGSDAPQNYPVQFALEAVTLGGTPLGLVEDAQLSRQADRIIIDRGSVEVWYDMALDQVEQSFALKVPSAPEELVVRLAVETELAWSEWADGLRFQNDRGGVDYTHALVFDGAGQRLELPIVATSGRIELRVPAAFMATAQAPIVVDPVLATYQIDAGNDKDLLAPDVAFDDENNVFGYVHTSVFSASDRDVRVETRGGNSDNFVNGAWVDFTSEDWMDGVIANDNATDTFLVAALRTDANLNQEVMGRTLAADTLNVSPAFLIGNTSSTATPWSNVSLDVGGQFNSSSLFMVIWEREFPSLGYSAIRRATVTPTMPHSTVTPPAVSFTTAVDGSSSISCRNPKISKSTGTNGNAEWRAVWIGEDTTTGDESIRGTRYSDAGTVLVGATELATISSSYNLVALDISEGLDTLAGPVAGSPIYCMAGYFTGPNGSNVFLFPVEEETILSEYQLSTLEHRSESQQQAFPTVASLSDRFIISYQEFEAGLYRTMQTVVDFTNVNLFGANERRALIVNTGPSFTGNAPGSASRFSGGWVLSRWSGTAAEYLDTGVWHMSAARSAASDPATPGVQYCIGNPNTTGDYGWITMLGSADTISSKTLRAEALPDNQFAYFLAGQGGFGTVQPPGSAGLLCLIGGSIGRYNLGVEIQFTGTSGAIDLTIDPTALRGPGGDVAAVAGAVWNFQAWHREDGGSSNFTNAISVTFE